MVEADSGCGGGEGAGWRDGVDARFVDFLGFG